MPTPRHLRHPAPHPPHRHTTRIPSPPLPSIRYPLTTLYRLAILDLYIRTSPRPTTSPSYSTSIYAPRPDLLPHVLIPSSVALSYPSAQRPTPLPHALTPSSASRSYLSILLPTPLPRPLPPPSSAKKFVLPHLKQAVTHLWKSFIPKEEEDLSSTSYLDDTVWITL